MHFNLPTQLKILNFFDTLILCRRHAWLLSIKCFKCLLKNTVKTLFFFSGIVNSLGCWFTVVCIITYNLLPIMIILKIGIAVLVFFLITRLYLGLSGLCKLYVEEQIDKPDETARLHPLNCAICFVARMLMEQKTAHKTIVYTSNGWSIPKTVWTAGLQLATKNQ